MRELQGLDAGHLNLGWEERKAFFEEEMGEQVRGEVKRFWKRRWKQSGRTG